MGNFSILTAILGLLLVQSVYTVSFQSLYDR